SDTIRLLGDKVAAKRVAERAGVPVVPWSGGPVEDEAEAAAQAERIGYPVVVKAAAGGGGRGIRMVREPAELAEAFAAARSEPPPVRGHAVEARLYAEDPEQGFAPAPGRLAELATPTGTGIRIDTGVREGDVVAAEFDSMITKIIAYGHDRAEALTRLRRALA